MFNSFPQPTPDSSGAPWIADWSAYQTIYDWSGTALSVPASSWGTFVNVTGSGWLTFVRAFSLGSSIAGNPDVRITIDGISYLFQGDGATTALVMGNLLSQPIYFKLGLKIEVFNRDAAANNMGCDYVYLLKNGTPNLSRQTILQSSVRKETYSKTTSITAVDVVNIAGSGYLLGMESSVYTTTSASYSSSVSVIVDGVTKMSNRNLVNVADATGNKQHFFNGPIRFTSSLRVMHLVGNTALGSMLRTFHTLD